MKQLGDAVSADEEAGPANRLCSQGLIDAASKLVEECKDLFKEIDLSMSGSGKNGNKVVLGFRQKLKWSYLGPCVELLRMNLERLKSSLAIMLNVLIYAEQRGKQYVFLGLFSYSYLSSPEGKAILIEQQTLVASFAIRETNAEKNIEDLKKAIEEEPAKEASKPAKGVTQAFYMNDPDEDESEDKGESTRDLPSYSSSVPPQQVFQITVSMLDGNVDRTSLLGQPGKCPLNTSFSSQRAVRRQSPFYKP